MMGFLKAGALPVLLMRALLTDPDHGIAGEFVLGHLEVARCRTFADAPRGVVLRTMAGAKPAAVVAPRIARTRSQRNATEMRAHADHDHPIRFLDALGIGLGIAKLSELDGLGLLDLFGRAVIDEDRMAAPQHLDALADGDLGNIHFDGCQR